MLFAERDTQDEAGQHDWTTVLSLSFVHGWLRWVDALPSCFSSECEAGRSTAAQAEYPRVCAGAASWPAEGDSARKGGGGWSSYSLGSCSSSGSKSAAAVAERAPGAAARGCSFGKRIAMSPRRSLVSLGAAGGENFAC